MRSRVLLIPLLVAASIGIPARSLSPAPGASPRGWAAIWPIGARNTIGVGQADEEELARAFEMLGTILGFPDVEPDELKRRVEEVGGLRFTKSVPIDFMTPEELAEYINRLFEEEYPPEDAERDERMLRAFGYLSADQDLRTIREQVLNENVAGFYDERPGAKKLYAVSGSSTASTEGSLNLLNQLILSHELRHALQDQHLDLGRMLGEGTDYDDRKLAALSLLEGDATLLMEMYLGSGVAARGGSGGQPSGRDALAGLFGLGGTGADGRAMAEMFAGPELRGAPPVVREQLVVPYLDGKQLAAAIYRRGGFRLLNESLEKPPRSMEQVLHPKKYLDQLDEPIEVNLIEVTGQPIESEGQLGEFLIRVLFEPSMAKQDAMRASEGWGGDRYALWPDGEGKYRVLWRTTWDSDRDAEEFLETLSRFASLHYGQGLTPSADSGTVTLQGADGSRSVISRSGREVVLERKGFQ